MIGDWFRRLTSDRAEGGPGEVDVNGQGEADAAVLRAEAAQVEAEQTVTELRIRAERARRERRTNHFGHDIYRVMKGGR